MAVHLAKDKIKTIKRNHLNLIQINMGNLCNQSCSHCHVAASPSGKKIMSVNTATRIMMKMADIPVDNVEITGGAPEMNKNLKNFIKYFHSIGKNLTVRTNLTVLADKKYAEYLKIFPDYNVNLTASLPSVDAGVTDSQRGRGVYNKSIKILKELNKIGYGTNSLKLDLVYNPAGEILPPPQKETEKYFKAKLAENHGISFNKLLSIANFPIKRYKNYLKKNNTFEKYMNMLDEKYNPMTIENLMCKNLLSVDYEGYVYDCDFSQAEGNKIKNYENKKFWEIDFKYFKSEIMWRNYCSACTASEGSGCFGSLTVEGKNGSGYTSCKTLDFNKNSKEYYGEKIKKSSDLITSACCSANDVPEYLKNILPLINSEVTEKYYGCGSPLPYLLEDQKILDLGCGTGRDIYIASKLTGEKGSCYGIDMTENQIKTAKKHLNEHTKKFNYKKPNVKFIHDEIENINKHFKNESIDIVISNCVLNLLEDKESVVKKVYDILKYGGEFYFSDVYADRRLPDNVKNDSVLHGECLGGALYDYDFEKMAVRAGFKEPRVISKKEIVIDNQDIKKLIKDARFFSITYRLFKIKNLEERCEDYGHTVLYKGGLKESSSEFMLDGSHVFYENKPERVCGNTALMLGETRFKKYFEITGNFNKHLGKFQNCSTLSHKNSEKNTSALSCC
ncbi:MAG: arsenosugar biosynthesis radical SAM protein ArsS [Spirochaetia bacterium]|nr:arsenosugar biosynthesis radical SAM protein ArsS [Spirochaetia bacterium]